MEKKIRKARVSGRFYPGSEEKLREKVNSFLTGEKNKTVKASIVPHAGYQFSGRLMGEVVSKIPEKENFIFLGVNHSGIGNKVSLSSRDFETPLGLVRCNRDLVNKVKKSLEKKGLDVKISEKAHEQEPSIEVELPFFQVSQEKFKIIPILLRNLSYKECCKIAEVLSEFLTENTVLIVSSDFTHYGRSFNFVPFKENKKENIYRLDNNIIEKILFNKSREVYKEASRSTVCGVYGLTIVTKIAEEKGWKAEKIDYYTSGEITSYEDGVVGYAGLVFS